MTDNKPEYINLRDLTPERMEELFGPAGEFKPHWYYNKPGDQIEVVWKNVPAYGEYINPDVYLIRSIDTNEIVGVTAPSVLLRLEKEGVAFSASKLDAIRDKVTAMIEKWEEFEKRGILVGLTLVELREIEVLLGDNNEETSED